MSHQDNNDSSHTESQLEHQSSRGTIDGNTQDTINVTNTDRKQFKRREKFEAIEEQNLPLLVDSGASTTWSVLYNKRSQDHSEIWITEFNNKFEIILSIGSLQREHLAD